VPLATLVTLQELIAAYPSDLIALDGIYHWELLGRSTIRFDYDGEFYFFEIGETAVWHNGVPVVSSMTLIEEGIDPRRAGSVVTIPETPRGGEGLYSA